MQRTPIPNWHAMLLGMAIVLTSSVLVWFFVG